MTRFFGGVLAGFSLAILIGLSFVTLKIEHDVSSGRFFWYGDEYVIYQKANKPSSVTQEESDCVQN